jgi:hypothetical protein
VQARSGADGVVVFTGQRPSEEIPQFLDAATVLARQQPRHQHAAEDLPAFRAGRRSSRRGC